jgi:hypothetical protein
MAEYIVQDALSDFNDDLISEFIELCRGNDYNKLSLLKIGDTIDNIYDKHIEKHSTADVVEVRHGWWAKKNVGFLKTRFCCSICGGWEHEYTYEHSGMNYCPNCGAKMDGKGVGE